MITTISCRHDNGSDATVYLLGKSKFAHMSFSVDPSKRDAFDKA